MYTGRVYSEKRDHIRMRVDCPVKLLGLDGDSDETALCVDMSANGVLIDTRQEVQVGERIRIRLEPALKISPAFAAEIEVVRQEFFPETKSYRFGGKITEMEPA